MINFPFRKYLKNRYSDFLLFENKVKENISESRKRILNGEICYNNSKEFNYIENIIIKDFKITGIKYN